VASSLTANTAAVPDTPRVLLTGASGYVGGRLLGSLEHQGYRVRCLARRPEMLAEKVGPATEVVAGDVLDRPSLDAGLRGIGVAYYLVHSMGSSGSFEETDRQAAANFGAAAKAAGVERIVYLGGLGSDADELSPHLRSRQEVGQILRRSGVPVLEFRASIVIGSGSLSFEMIRSLVERLPIMITPKWVNVPAQPIAIDDLLEYLVAALQLPVAAYGVYEIGGADRMSYADIMRVYARHRGLRLRMIREHRAFHGGAGRRVAPGLCRAPGGSRGGGASSPRQRRNGVRGDALVRCALLVGRFADLGWRAVRLAAGGFADRTRRHAARRRLQADSGDRRRNRLVRVELALAAARLLRSPRGGRRHATRPAFSHDPSRR
jgi:uncharacterized protein YbjT (DUF2867 family)